MPVNFSAVSHIKYRTIVTRLPTLKLRTVKLLWQNLNPDYGFDMDSMLIPIINRQLSFRAVFRAEACFCDF